MTDPTAPLPDEELAAIEARRLLIHDAYVKWLGMCDHFDHGSGEYRQCDDPDEGIPQKALPGIIEAALRAERAARARVEEPDPLRAALERLDAIARVEPRNAVGEAEFDDALAQSFTALHPNERPVWKPALAAKDAERPGEYGRLLAERDRLIADGADPADLDVPKEP